jgi:TrmH family RNA methyltransferase
MEKNMTRTKLIDDITNLSRVSGIASDEVALAKSLVENKCQDKSLFVCEGLWAVDKLIQKGFKVTHFFYNADRLTSKDISEENLQKIAKIAKYSEKTYAISEKACKKISDREGYDEFFIVAKLKSYTLASIEKMIEGNNNVMAIVMDGLEQPGNIGAILRSFDCAGGDFAIVTNKQARLSNSRLVRSSLGASFMLPVLEADIDEVQDWLVKNNFRCIVTDLQGKQSFKETDYSGRIAIISGNEHTGISASWRSVKNAESIIIPMLGSCESLNVGFASTLVAYEAGLQKFGNKKNK